MFDNKFLKHDPLVEAVKAAQADGEMRRQAIAIVNEAYDVYSRNAVIREELAAYDADVEAVYADLKEGKWEGSKEDKDEDKKLAKKHGMTMKQWEKSDADKKHDAKEKMDEEALDEISKGLAARYKEKAQDRAFGGKDDYMSHEGASKKKMKKVMHKFDNRMTGITRANKRLGIKNPDIQFDEELAKKDYDKDGKVESPKDEVWGSRLRAAKKAGKMEEAKGTAAVQNLKHRDFKETRHPNKNAVTKAPVPGVSIAEDQLDEISKGRAISAYRQKEGEGRDTSKLHGLIKRKFGGETAKHAERAGASDAGNLSRRGESHGTDRLSRAKPSSEMRKTASGKIHKQDVESKKSEMKFRKSMSKFDKPRGHLPEEHIDEAAYSAKAARAGKDIGKPGPGFARIAKKAGARYGSAERGKKVAGAILKKIRAKHMHEDNNG